MKKLQNLLMVSSCLATFAMAPAANAQSAQPEDEAEDADSILVVGSLIRGAEVVGSQTIGVDADAIVEKGAVSTNELLGLVPQIANTFNGRFEVDPRGISSGLSIQRPNLRNLPGANSASGGTALVLVNGFRMAPLGTQQAAIDVDVIPPSALAGLDIVTDGGSSLYGADAVSGVINFRTMRKFEGLKADFNYGVGDTFSSYEYWDASLTGGLSWSTGNAWITGSYGHRDSILNSEAPWSQSQVFNANGIGRFTGTQCDTPQQGVVRFFRIPPSGAAFTRNPAAPGAGPGTLGSGCDRVGEGAYLPEQERYNVYAAVTQEFGENIELRTTGYWAKRDTAIPIVPRGFTSAETTIINTTAELLNAFPAAAQTPIGGLFTVPTGNVGFRFTPNAAYVNTPNTLGYETFGITPELTFKFGGDWQLRLTGHGGQSDNYQSFPSTNTTLAQCYITGCTATASPTGVAIAAGQLNPLNVAAASPAVIGAITDFASQQQTNQSLIVGRLVADGPIFQLPGGDAKIAVGVEYQYNYAESRVVTGTFASINSLPFKKYDRNAKSAFAELQLPIAEWIDVSASLRYDDYSDFGTTTNPSLGASLKPVEWLKIFGHWSTSYNAPTAFDGLGIAVGRFALNQYTATSRPTDPAPVSDNGQGVHAMILDGTNPGTQPQTSENWAVGFEATPMDGLNFGGQFYSLKFDDILAAVNPQNVNTYTTNPELYIYNGPLNSAPPAGLNCPSSATTYYQCLLSQLSNGAQLGAQIQGSAVALVVDRRTSNIGTAKVEGIDFHINYVANTDFGQVFAGLSGTRTTKAVSNFGTPVNELQIGGYGPKLTASANFGVKAGGFSSRLTINHSGKFNDPNPNFAGTVGTDVNPFTTVNLALSYEFGEESGILGGTQLRFGVDNLFEEKPQVIRRTTDSFVGYANYTLGRIFKFGISKTF